MQIELTIPGRPVPWARPRIRKQGGMYTATKQVGHRAAVGACLRIEALASKIGKFVGPTYLQALFVYGKEPGTWFRLSDIESMQNKELKMPFDLGDKAHDGRPDLDNLTKQLMEAIEDSGVLDREDGQISIVTAAKVKR